MWSKSQGSTVISYVASTTVKRGGVFLYVAQAKSGSATKPSAAHLRNACEEAQARRGTQLPRAEAYSYTSHRTPKKPRSLLARQGRQK